jgi:hypothetical protein
MNASLPPRRFATGVLVVAAAAGCGTSDITVLLASGEDSGSSPPYDAAASPDGASSPEAALPYDAAVFGTRTEYCDGTGPPLLVDIADGGAFSATCPGQLAQRAFRYALCACDNYTSSSALVTDAFDSTTGAYDPSTAVAGASVGVNGDLGPGPLQIGGSLWASDQTDLTTSSTLQVQGDLHAGGEVNANGPSLVVDGDAWLAGGLQATAAVTIKGTLYAPPGAPVTVPAGTAQINGTSRETFSVSTACDCDPSLRVDIAGVVDTYRTHNDDAALNIDPSLLDNRQSALTTTEATFGCGRIFLTQIGPSNVPIRLTAQGRVAIFVGGDITTQSDFIIDAPPGNQVDLFVKGTVTVVGQFQVGDESNPAGARTYVGGNSVNLRGTSEFAGNLYAPSANLVLGASAPTTLFGSLFIASLSAGSALSIHYDQAILNPASSPACPVPTACKTCSDCGNQACNSGTCGACAQNEQCCAPFVCDVAEGTCVTDVIAR